MIIKRNLIPKTNILWVCKSCVKNAIGNFTKFWLLADWKKSYMFQNLCQNDHKRNRVLWQYLINFWSGIIEIMRSECLSEKYQIIRQNHTKICIKICNNFNHIYVQIENEKCSVFYGRDCISSTRPPVHCSALLFIITRCLTMKLGW